MAPQCSNIVALLIVILFVPNPSLATKTELLQGMRLNTIDGCWRWNQHWRRNRQQLATCSIGFAGKMMNNIGRDLVYYTVSDPSDNAIHPKPGTLRYGATMVRGKVWIIFQRDMSIKLEKPLLLSSYTAIDGRGASIHIAGNACLIIFKASNIIIHGLRIHNCKAQAPSRVMGPEGKIVEIGQVDGDAIRLGTASKSQDGLLDVTRGSTNITISNNWFRNQDRVMLLGHNDAYLRDNNMKVTLIYNHFGPNCNKEYQVSSKANLFIAPKSGNKEATWRRDSTGNKNSWRFYSLGDVFENGASFVQTGVGGAKPDNNQQQVFSNAVRSITRSAGALRC
ncbi:hypothetical protein UlMin_009119 [Ulmus minor]